MIYFGIVIILAALLATFFAADRMIAALHKIAAGLNWREFVVSFLLVAFATSAPEFFVGLASAISGRSALSFGNIIGANIINITLILGIAALFGKRLHFPEIVGIKDLFLSGIIALLPIILIFDGSLSRVDGIALLAVSVLYFIFIFEERAEHRKRLNSVTKKELKKALVLFIFWTIVLLFAAKIAVDQSQDLARKMELSSFLFGVIIVSLGTTLPEAVFGLRSISRGQINVIYGNLFGTLVVNSGLILGTVAIISPIVPQKINQVMFSGLMLFLSYIFFAVLARSGKKLVWQEGAALIALYFLSIIGQYFIRT